MNFPPSFVKTFSPLRAGPPPGIKLEAKLTPAQILDNIEAFGSIRVLISSPIKKFHTSTSKLPSSSLDKPNGSV
ncbi:hypothetical protein D3C80_1248560 [compost metagenome]